MKISTSEKSIPYTFKGISVSCVEYGDEPGDKVGMTLLHSDKYLSYYISKRGKDIAGFSLDMINREGYRGTKSIVLVGGSVMGLEGICGVNRAMLKENIENGKDYHEKAIGVCCYTFNLFSFDGIQSKYLFPDVKLGKFSYESLSNQPIPIGQAGVGCCSAVAKIDTNWKSHLVPTGQGAHFIQVGRLKVLVIINLNSIGLVHDNGRLLHKYKKHKYLNEVPNLDNINENLSGIGNTTLCIVLTNIKLTNQQREYYGEKLHDVIASMIYPYGTIYDGDTMFLASTSEYKSDDVNQLLVEGEKCIRNAILSIFE